MQALSEEAVWHVEVERLEVVFEEEAGAVVAVENDELVGEEG